VHLIGEPDDRLARRHAERAQGRAGLILLVQADAALSARELTEVYDMARAAGFASVQIAAESPPSH